MRSARQEDGIHTSLNSGFSDAPFAYSTGRQGLTCPVVPGIMGWEVIAVSCLCTSSTEKNREAVMLFCTVRGTQVWLQCATEKICRKTFSNLMLMRECDLPAEYHLSFLASFCFLSWAA